MEAHHKSLFTKYLASCLRERSYVCVHDQKNCRFHGDGCRLISSVYTSYVRGGGGGEVIKPGLISGLWTGLDSELDWILDWSERISLLDISPSHSECLSRL